MMIPTTLMVVIGQYIGFSSGDLISNLDEFPIVTVNKQASITTF